MDKANVREELDQRMRDLHIEGYSTMGKFTPEDQLDHVAEIEKILRGRKNVVSAQAKEAEAAATNSP